MEFTMFICVLTIIGLAFDNYRVRRTLNRINRTVHDMYVVMEGQYNGHTK